jgi:hypothetical protein
MHYFVSLLYCICWLLHISAVACHHQGVFKSLWVTWNINGMGNISKIYLKLPDDGRLLPKHVETNTQNKVVVKNTAYCCFFLICSSIFYRDSFICYSYKIHRIYLRFSSADVHDFNIYNRGQYRHIYWLCNFQLSVRIWYQFYIILWTLILKIKLCKSFQYSLPKKRVVYLVCT